MEKISGTIASSRTLGQGMTSKNSQYEGDLLVPISNVAALGDAFQGWRSIVLVEEVLGDNPSFLLPDKFSHRPSLHWRLKQ